MEDIDAIKKMGDSSDEDLDGKYFLKIKISKKIGILLPKLFRPTVRKNCSSDQENFSKFLRSLEQFIQTAKGQNNFW